ncbi:DUF5666 domain-containing protein [Marinomonas sp. THO17]|uniref:DUF5666 domain-containing protein n=1 Tax=Marinomonas sp. THO17 TaxID=3149048 RepID=UPI00336C2B03
MNKWLSAILITFTCLSLVLANEDRGFGGTGKYDQSEDRGLGGTGKSAEEDHDRGFGGTGIVGTITEFGSIWVNGEEIEVDSHTQISLDGVSAQENALRLGQQVKVLAHEVDGEWFAQQIQIEHALIGRIEKTTSAIKILGVNIHPSADYPGTWPELKNNDYVKVSGFFVADEFFATDINVTSDEGRWQVIAPVTFQTNKGWQIAGQALPKDIIDTKEGEVITLRGQYIQKGTQLNWIRHEQALPFSGKADNYLIEKRSRKGNEIKRFSSKQWRSLQKKSSRRYQKSQSRKQQKGVFDNFSRSSTRSNWNSRSNDSRNTSWQRDSQRSGFSSGSQSRSQGRSRSSGRSYR